MTVGYGALEPGVESWLFCGFGGRHLNCLNEFCFIKHYLHVIFYIKPIGNKWVKFK